MRRDLMDVIHLINYGTFLTTSLYHHDLNPDRAGKC